MASTPRPLVNPSTPRPFRSLLQALGRSPSLIHQIKSRAARTRIPETCHRHSTIEVSMERFDIRTYRRRSHQAGWDRHRAQRPCLRTTPPALLIISCRPNPAVHSTPIQNIYCDDVYETGCFGNMGAISRYLLPSLGPGQHRGLSIPDYSNSRQVPQSPVVYYPLVQMLSQTDAEETMPYTSADIEAGLQMAHDNQRRGDTRRLARDAQAHGRRGT